LFFINGGVVEREKILPESWISEAGSSKMIGAKKVNHGYMWLISDASANPIHKGALLARSIFGQSIYLSTADNVGVVIWSAHPKPTGTDAISDEDFCAAVVKRLD